ncbi:MAG: hypothetical protein RL681_193 [Candidatus Parcubacteria bacterium]|jgi:hypothetical protein
MENEKDIMPDVTGERMQDIVQVEKYMKYFDEMKQHAVPEDRETLEKCAKATWMLQQEWQRLQDARELAKDDVETFWKNFGGEFPAEYEAVQKDSATDRPAA